jgi:hypothetical protein
LAPKSNTSPLQHRLVLILYPTPNHKLIHSVSNWRPHFYFQFFLN